MEGVSEWSERMDIAGSNHWLPAYGFQQPNQLQQVLLQQHQEGAELIGNDGGTVLITGQQQQFLFLETIVEETSDDLRSESDRSGPAGWPDSDSDTESVIHVPTNLEERADWSGSERDLAVPKKRRRRHGAATDSNDEETSLSRSSSLLQFECLEKHCEDVFRTTDPFPPPSPASAISSFSFDSLESNRWRFSASPDSLDSTGPSSTSSSGDEGASSDDTLQHSSWSSSRGSSFRSSGGSRLRSFRSFDSLNLLQQNNNHSHHSLAELSQSLNSTFLLQHPRADLSQTDVPAEITTQKNNCSSQESSTTDSTATVKDAGGGNTSDGKSDPTTAKQQRSAENLSEDSGFGDHCCIPASSSSTTVTVGTIVEDEDGDNDNDSCTSSYYSDCSAGGSSGGAAGSSETSETERKGTPKRKVLKLARESEKRGWETDESKFNGSCWQSAPSLLTREGKAVRSKFGSGQDQLSSVPHDLNLAGEHDDEDDDEDTFERYSDAHSSPAVASPQRARVDEEDVSEDPAQESQYKMASRLPVASTPNLTYMGQDDFLRHELRHSSMTQVPLKDGMPEENHRPISKSLTPLPTKGVHFSPVVSEVSWRDSYSDDGGEAGPERKEEKEEEDEEEMERALMSLEKGEDVAVRAQKTPMPLTLQKLQIGLPVGPEERERYVMELNDNDLLALQPPAPLVTPTSHVVHSTATSSGNTTVSAVPMEAKQGSNDRRDSDLSSTSSGKKSGKFGSFFQRFSLRRLSGRVVGNSSKNKQKEEKKKGTGKKAISNANPTTATAAVYEDVTIIPLHPPTPETKPAPPDVVVVSSKPPLPPLPPRGGGVVASANKTTPSTRRRPEAAASSSPSLPARAQCDATSGGNNGLSPGQLNMSVIDPAAVARRPPPLGLLETDLDSVVRRQNGATTTSKKARSLMNLGDAGNQRNIRAGHGTEDAMLLKPPNSAGPAMTSSSNGGHRPLPYGAPTDARAKSMEFLLDKENQAAVQPPENELQKGSGAAGERVMSEHQLRVQRSLQKLNVPDWYKNSSVARGPEGFLLKRGSDSGQGARDGWPGLGSKTTSLSSLGSTQSAATARSPTSHLLSPSPTPHVFTRWSTSRLNSGGTSASTSPCGSTRSSFNYRQPYLGWRSQERLSRPRTPAERLAAGLLPATSPSQPQMLSSPLDHKQIMKHEEELAQLQREREADDEMMQQVPNLSEVRTSIKEVTSAIVHYVSGVGGAGASQWDSLSPPISGTTPRSGSPRGSSGRLCWLESSFVGSRPLDSPETPLTLPSGDVSKTLESLQQQQQQQQKQQQEATKVAHAVPDNLYLELNTVPQHQVNGEYLLT